ncbi:Protein disulfide-isomerase [Nymphon striatum]|nr:Protein disulfide-isomerase [Nymphon striatum]
MRSAVLLFAALCCQSVFADVADDEDHVLVLTKDNFDELVKTNQHILVEFYAPWCGHCKALEPEYKKAAASLHEEGSALKLGKVDATIESELAEKHGVRGYPTIKFYKGGNPVEYSGGRTAPEIIQWLKKKTGPPATTVKSAEEAKKAKEDNEVSIFGFFKDVSSPDAKIFLEAAETIELPIYITSEQDVFTALEVESDGIVLFKQFDDLRNNFDGEMTKEAISEFVLANSLPLIVEFNQESAQKIFGGEIKSHHLLFAERSSEEYKKITEFYADVAKQFKGKILCVFINAEEEEHERIMEFFGITKEELPTNRIIQLKDDMAKFKSEDKELTKENIVKFISSVLDGKMKQHLLSQDVPEDWDKNPVKVLVSSKFDEVVFDKSKDVLVEFYAPWCGHCKQLEPIYNELGDKYKDNNEILIGKMDSTVNELEHTKIQSFPTIKLYQKETNKVIDYNGARDLENLMKFVESGGASQKKPEAESEEEGAEEEDAEAQPKDEL